MAISDLWRGPSYNAVVVAIPQLSVNVSHDLWSVVRTVCILMIMKLASRRGCYFRSFCKCSTYELGEICSQLRLRKSLRWVTKRFSHKINFLVFPYVDDWACIKMDTIFARCGDKASSRGQVGGITSSKEVDTRGRGSVLNTGTRKLALGHLALSNYLRPSSSSSIIIFTFSIHDNVFFRTTLMSDRLLTVSLVTTNCMFKPK